MDAAIEAVETIKQKKEEEVKKLDDALEILQGVDLGTTVSNDNVEPKEVIVDNQYENVTDEVVGNQLDETVAGPFDVQAPIPGPLDEEVVPDVVEAIDVEEQLYEPKPDVPGPFDPIQEEINDNKPEEEGIIENTLSGITDAFSPKPAAQQGGKRKNRKSRKGLRTKRFRGGYRRKTRRGRRNSRRLRK